MRKPFLLLGMLLLMQQFVAQQPNAHFASNTSQSMEQFFSSASHLIRTNFISFHLNGGLIFFKAKLNGVSETFVLDTGSPGLLINERVNQKTENSFSAVGVSGGLHFQKEYGNTFEMGETLCADVHTLCTNLSHLEKVKSQRFKGMVGHELLKNNEVVLDYKNKQMGLLEGGAKEEVSGYYRSSSVPIDFQQHFAVIKVKIGRKTYHFGLDTGAEVNIIDADIARWLPNRLFEITEKIKIRGVSKKGIGTKVGEISNCEIAGKKVEGMEFVLMDMDVLNEGRNLELDGLLGFPFLSSELFSIDYVSELLHVWKAEEEALAKKQ
ncbi:MAG: retropepsin-like aspartic protease [Saprospiraceae bacterium]